MVSKRTSRCRSQDFAAPAHRTTSHLTWYRGHSQLNRFRANNTRLERRCLWAHSVAKAHFEGCSGQIAIVLLGSHSHDEGSASLSRSLCRQRSRVDNAGCMRWRLQRGCRADRQLHRLYRIRWMHNEQAADELAALIDVIRLSYAPAYACLFPASPSSSSVL